MWLSSVGDAWTWAIAAPAARSSLMVPFAGQLLVPGTTVSRLAGTPASRPSRSAPSRRGAGSPYCSAMASAAALVAIGSCEIRLLGDRRTTADDDPSGERRSIHHGLSPSCRERIAMSAFREPSWDSTQTSVCSSRPGTRGSPFPHWTSVSQVRVRVNKQRQLRCRRPGQLSR